MSISVAAEAQLFGRSTQSGLIGRVYRENPDHGLEFVDELVVPVGDYGHAHSHARQALASAPSGRYLIQLALPNGRVVNQRFEIAENRSVEVFVPLPHEAPYEWSTLQSLAGNFALRRGTGGAPPSPAPNESARRGEREKPQACSIHMLKSDAEHGGTSVLSRETLAGLARIIAERTPPDELSSLLVGSSATVQPVHNESDFALFEFVHAGSLADGAQRQSWYFGPGTPLDRVYLLVRSARGAQLIALPAPWTANGEEIEIQLLLDRRAECQRPEFALTIADPMINSVLGYAANGAVHEAAQLMDFATARKLLFHKISSPLAATVGGYLLLLGLDRSAYRAHADDWQQWLDNLCYWFDWLPDGAVLRAAKYFVLGDKDRDGALEALMLGFDRGLPFFTFGMRLMIEGMRRFAHEGEALAQERLAILESLAAVADPQQHFLTLNLATS